MQIFVLFKSVDNFNIALPPRASLFASFCDSA